MMSVPAFGRRSALPIRRCANDSFVGSRQTVRRVHNVPVLPHGHIYEERGLGEALSPRAYRVGWVDNQTYLVDRLNQFTAGSALASLTTKELLTRFARQPNQAALFNYASMAHNNHFFFAGLTPSTSAESKALPSEWLASQINKSFSSLDSLRVSFLASANAMFGPGFTWLVARRDSMMPSDPSGHLAILNTYLAGSPYPQAHFRSQQHDMNTADTAIPAGENAQTWALKQGGASAVGLHGIRGAGAGFGRSPRGYLAPGGQDLQVLMCLSTWEHVWLTDYGIGGKETYLERIWDHIDWKRVESNWSERPRKMGVRESQLYQT